MSCSNPAGTQFKANWRTIPLKSAASTTAGQLPASMLINPTPGVAPPGVARPGVATPGVARPGVARPGVATPGPFGAEALALGVPAATAGVAIGVRPLARS